MSDTAKHAKTAPRVLIMVESDNGFGHFNIVKEVAKKIEREGGTVGLASGTFFHSGEAFDFGHIPQYHLPSIIFDQRKGFYFDQTDQSNLEVSTRKNYLNQPQRQEIRKAQIKKACAEFKPDIILFEMYPFLMRFRDSDLDAIKEMYPDRNKRPEISCLSRDIVHSAKPADTVDLLNNEFDRILVRGDGKLNKLQDCVPEYADIKIPIQYAGNIVARKPKSQNRAEEDKPVLVFSGGGYKKTDVEFFESSIRSRKFSKELYNKPWTVVISNNCAQEEFERYQALAKEEAPDGSIQVIRPMQNNEFSQLLNNSSAAIVRSSYNTTFELARSKVPFVVIPRSVMGYDKEQQFRADVLSSSGLQSHLKKRILNYLIHLIYLVKH